MLNFSVTIVIWSYCHSSEPGDYPGILNHL